MIKSTPLPNFKVFAIFLVVAFLAASCGSYQQTSYYDDGIYASGDRVVHVEKKSAEAVRLEEQESNIYGDYFGEKAKEYGEILDDEIFTDIDSYSSQMPNDSIPYGEQTDYFAYNNTYNGNPGWGDNPTSLTINVYDNWGWGGYYGWNRPYWGYGYGWGGYPYYGWGWTSPWRYNRWGWSGYYGWNYPYYYGGWGYAGYYGWGGYYNYGWRPYYYNNYYGRNYAYGYTRGRRGYSSSTIPGTSLRGRSNLASRTSGYSSRYSTDSGRSNRSVGTYSSRTSRSYSNGTTARRAVSADAIARNQSYRTSRSTRTSPNYGSSSRSYSSYGTTPSARSNGTYSRSSSVNRSSSSPTYRSSGRSTRSYQSSPRTTAPSRSNYSRSSSGSSSRSSYSRSSSGSSSRSYSSGGSSSRSSGGASRSSGGSSRGGRSNGRN